MCHFISVFSLFNSVKACIRPDVFKISLLQSSSSLVPFNFTLFDSSPTSPLFSVFYCLLLGYAKLRLNIIYLEGQ